MEEDKEQEEKNRQELETQYQALQDMVEPYRSGLLRDVTHHLVICREQLETFELERRGLLAQAEGAEGEAKKLALQVSRQCLVKLYLNIYLKFLLP